MSNDTPVSTIYEQPLTTPPFIIDSTLVDDAVALVDDPVALSGGQITIIEDLRTTILPNTPQIIIKKYS